MSVSQSLAVRRIAGSRPRTVLQKRQAAAVGEVHVQDGQGKGPLPFQRLPGLGQGAAEGHRPVLSLQGQANPLAQGQVIFY